MYGIGAGLGFLWYNFYPAQIFMGDTGSLTLGGVLATISIFLKQELLLEKSVDKKPIDELPLSLKEKVVLKKLIKAVEGTDHLLSE